MTQTENIQTRLWQTIVWALRLTVVLQCLGNWRWLTQIEETPLLHWLLSPTDVGGLACQESTALAVQQVVGWLVLVTAGWVLWRPHVVALALLVLLQTAITVAMWQLADGYSLQASWAPPQLLALFPFATQLARIAAPLGLLLLHNQNERSLQQNRRISGTMQALRWSVAIVFVAHGIEAWQLNPKFVDLMINSDQRLLGIGISEATAEQTLAVVGVVDLLIAIICLSVRWPPALWWMALWGGLTAMSRLAANGWEMSWHEVLTRTPHFGVPLAVVLWWHLLKYNAAPKSIAEATNQAEQGSH